MTDDDGDGAPEVECSHLTLICSAAARRLSATGGTTALTPAALQFVRIYACVSEAFRRRERLGA